MVMSESGTRGWLFYLLHHDYKIIIGISYQLINLCLSVNLSAYRSVLQKPNTAVEYVAAHLSKIHGLDWHPDNEYILATSSQDNSVRVITITIVDHIVHSLLFCCSLTYINSVSIMIYFKSSGTTDNPGSTSISCHVRCLCGRPDTRYSLNRYLNVQFRYNICFIL